MSSSLFSLSGKTAILTGATRGIGKAIAIGLAEAGANIILLQRDVTRTDTKLELEKLGRRCDIVECDLLDQESVSGAIERCVDAGLEFDILVNCGGITFRVLPEDYPDEKWNEVIQVNLTAPFQLSKNFAKHLLSRKKPGRIINIGSLMSFQGGKNVPAYASSKGGIQQLTQALSNAWSRHGVLVNAIAPGYVETDMTTPLMADEVRHKEITDRTPIGRWGKPEEFAGPAVFLASQASSFVTGSMLVVDGGWMGW